MIDDATLAVKVRPFDLKFTDVVRLFGSFEVERRYGADNVGEHGIAKARDTQTFCNDAVGQARDINIVFSGLNIKGGDGTVGPLVY